MFDRITRSFELAKSSWNVLRTDKKLLLFPVVSGIGVLVVLISFIGPLVALVVGGQIKFEADQNGEFALPWWSYPLTFAFYFCNYFVIVFCNAALVSCALMRFNGQEPTLGDGFRAAASRLPQIFAWALVSATVGLLLKIVENANEKIGEIISALLGTAWTVLTFFVVPVLVVEKVGPFSAVAPVAGAAEEGMGRGPGRQPRPGAVQAPADRARRPRADRRRRAVRDGPADCDRPCRRGAGGAVPSDGQRRLLRAGRDLPDGPVPVRRLRESPGRLRPRLHPGRIRQEGRLTTMQMTVSPGRRPMEVAP